MTPWNASHLFSSPSLSGFDPSKQCPLNRVCLTHLSFLEFQVNTNQQNDQEGQSQDRQEVSTSVTYVTVVLRKPFVEREG